MMTKAFTRTLQSRSGLIFFAILAIYNLLLGIYLKDFLMLSPMLLAFYLLSALPTLFFVIKIRSATMRAIVYIVLFFVLLLSTLSSWVGMFAFSIRDRQTRIAASYLQKDGLESTARVFLLLGIMIGNCCSSASVKPHTACR